MALLAQAALESSELGHSYVGTEHVLLALVRDRSQSVASLLAAQGFSHGVCRERVLDILYADPADAQRGSGAGHRGARPDRLGPASPSEVVIRPTTDDDVPALRGCLDEVARERSALAITAAPPAAVIAEFRRQLREAGGVDLVAISGTGEVAGWIDIRRLPWEGMQHVGSLGMGVRREYRGRGLGRALLGAALAYASAGGITRVELEVFASNTPAIRLYESMQFRVEGRKIGARRLDARTDDLVVMARIAAS